MNSTVTLLNESGHWLVTQLGRMSMELAVLAGVVLVALYVLRVKSPALRHLFWGLLLAKPVLTFLVASPLSLYAFLWPPAPEVVFTPPSAVVQEVQAPMVNPIAPQSDLTPAKNPPRVETPPFWRQVDRYGLATLAWVLVASLFGLRLLLGCAYVGFLRGSARTQSDGVLFDLVAAAAATLGVRRHVAIATTTVCHGPVLAGIFRPVILLPETMAAALTQAQLRLVITHELAHARRWDNLVLLVQRLAEMLFFFHPVVWLCGWMMRREAEAACDDMVVNAYGDTDGTGAAAYADSLTRVAEMKCGITRRLLVNTFAAAESNFHRRIRRILSGRRTRMTLWLSLATGAALILIGVVGLPTVASAPPQDGRMDLEKALDATGSMTFENQHLSEVFKFITSLDKRINLCIDWRVVKVSPNQDTTRNTRVYGPEPEYVTDGMVKFIDVRDVSWRAAIDALLKPLGLTAAVKNQYVWVSSPAMIARDAAQSAPKPQHPDPALLKALALPVSVEFEGLNVREILEFVSSSFDVQFSIDDTVLAPKADSGPVPPTCITNGFVPRINIQNVTVSAMLEAVLRPLNLVAVPDGKVVRVTAYGAAGDNTGAANTVSQASPPGNQTAADPAVEVDSIVVDPKTGKASFANVRISGEPVRVWPGAACGGYLAKSISMHPPAITLVRQSDGMEWNVPVDPAAVRTGEGDEDQSKAVLRLLDTRVTYRIPRAKIQTREESPGIWYRIPDEFGKYTVKEIDDEAKTVLLTTNDGQPPILLKRVTAEGQRGEDFESCATGTDTWPEAWIADGNASDHAVCHVDGTTFKDTHGNTLRLHGDSPTWSPLAHLLTNVRPPFRMAFDVYLESGNSNTTCVVGVRREPSWKAPGVILFDTVPPGEVKGLEPVAGGGVMSKGQATNQLHMELARWYHVELTLQEEQERQTLAITLNDGTGVQGPVQLSTDTTPVKDMPYLQLEVRSGTAWFDNVSMTPLETTQAVSENVESGNSPSGTGAQPSVEKTAAQGNPNVGPLVVAPLIAFLDDKVKAEWQGQGISGDKAVLDKLQEQTVGIMQKRLDGAGLKDVKLEKRANGRVAVQIPPAMDAGRVGLLLTQPGMSRFCPAASRDEVIQALQEIEKNPSFQGRLAGLLDTTSKDYFPTVPADKHAAAKAVVGEINDARPRLLPEGKMFFLGSKSSPNTLYLLDKNSPMASVKVKSASATPDTDNPGKAKINFSFSDEDAQRFGDLTQSLLGKGLAILINWEVQSVPIVRSKITQSGQIVGNYTLEEATDIAARISVPEYPAQLLVLSDPTATPASPAPAKVEDVRKAVETRYYGGIDEGLWNRLLCKFLVPVFDPATGEELSFAHYDKAKGELSVRNLPDNLGAFEVMITHFEAGHLQTESAQKKEDANEPHVTIKHSPNLSITAGKIQGDLEKGRLSLTDNPVVSTPTMPEIRGEEVIIDTAAKTLEVKHVRVNHGRLAAGTETAPTARFDNVSMTPLQPAPPENKDITASASTEDKTALAEFRLYAAHGAVTQNDKPLPNLQDTMASPFKEAKASPLMLRALLTSAEEGDGFAVGGAPFVMDGRTLTWAGKDTPDPDCATLLASTTFRIVSDERISQTISIPKESGASGSVQQDAVMAVVCHLVKRGQIRLWITPKRLDESGTNAVAANQNPWMHIAGAAPQDTWQLMVLDITDDTGGAQQQLLLFWRLKYGSGPEPGDDRPQVKTGKVVFGEDTARVPDNVPQYTAELRLMAGTRTLVEAFCTQLAPGHDIAHGPEVERAFTTDNAAGIEAFFKTNENVPDLEFLSAPRITISTREDHEAISLGPGKKAIKTVMRINGDSSTTSVRTREAQSIEEFIDQYSPSLRAFCGDVVPTGIIADCVEFTPQQETGKTEPMQAGILMALSLSETDAPDQFRLDLYINNKEARQASRGLAFWKPIPAPEIFESPIILHMGKEQPFTMGNWVVAVTKHRDPEKAMLAVIHIEPAGSGRQYAETQS